MKYRAACSGSPKPAISWRVSGIRPGLIHALRVQSASAASTGACAGSGLLKPAPPCRTATFHVWIVPKAGAKKKHRRHATRPRMQRSEEHTSELQSRGHLVCRLLLEKK